MRSRTLVELAWPYRYQLVAAAALAALQSVAALGLPWLAGSFAGAMLGPDREMAPTVLLWLMAVLALQSAAQITNRYLSVLCSEGILADLRVRIYAHLQSLPLNFHDRKPSGDLLALLTHEVEQVSGFLTQTMVSMLPLLLTATGSIVLMYAIDPALTLIVVPLVLIFYLLLRVLGRVLRPLGMKAQEANAAVYATAQENLLVVAAIKAFTREAAESRRYQERVDAAKSLEIRQQRIQAVLEPACQFLAATAIVAILWQSSTHVGQADMSAAASISFLLYAVLLTRPLSSLAGIYGQVQLARGTMSRLQSVMAEVPEAFDESQPPLALGRGAGIEFRNVTFGYPDRPLTLYDLNLRIRSGETVAIIGENGAGKSTIAHLLIRLYTPESGQIFIGDQDVAEVNLQSLRRHIGIVQQHVLLANSTVRENIGFAVPAATPDKIVRAAKLAQAHAFISALPQGYDTVIGGQGLRLSGGQRQRIALARVLLMDPPIIILDEATAMFDPDGEALLIDQCREAFASRTVILITHRPASLALADRIVTLVNGQISAEHSANDVSAER